MIGVVEEAVIPSLPTRLAASTPLCSVRLNQIAPACDPVVPAPFQDELLHRWADGAAFRHMAAAQLPQLSGQLLPQDALAGSKDFAVFLPARKAKPIPLVPRPSFRRLLSILHRFNGRKLL